jgi:hypothetical protein
VPPSHDGAVTEELLTGGGINQVVRIGTTVRRATGPWTPLIHDFLRHVRANGFTAAPEPLGIDGSGREILSYLPGEVSNYPMTPAARTDIALITAAKLLRLLHDATVGYPGLDDPRWQLPRREPVEVVCHGDFGPHNCVLDDGRVIGVIDFDTAHPGSRLWDVAHAVYRFAPLAPEEAVSEQVRRTKLFCDAYGLQAPQRTELPEAIEARLTALVELIEEGAAAGDPAFQRHLAEGHADLYLRHREHVRAHASELSAPG